jgi:hypothetical protein
VIEKSDLRSVFGMMDKGKPVIRRREKGDEKAEREWSVFTGRTGFIPSD